MQNGALRELPAGYNSNTGEFTTPDGLPISQIAPLTSEYASVAGWYVERAAIRFRGRRYTQLASPRVLGIWEVEPAGVHDRVPVFVAKGDSASAPVIYLPTRPGCEFQPYVTD